MSGQWVSRHIGDKRTTKRHLVVSSTARTAKTACAKTITAGEGTLVYEDASPRAKLCAQCAARAE